MKSLRTLLLAVLPGLFALVAAAWEPKVSMEDGWRWTELDFLNDYDIVHGTRGPDNEVWFVHQEGILVYDGVDVTEYPIPRLAKQPIKDILRLTDGRILVSCDFELIVWKDGEYRTFASPDGRRFLRNGIRQGGDGRTIATTASGVYELRNDGLFKIETGHTDIAAVLIDLEGNLWVGETGRSIDVFSLTMIAGNPVAGLLHRFKASSANPFGPQFFMDSQGRVLVLDPDENDLCYLYEDYGPQPSVEGLRRRGVQAESVRVVERTPGELWIGVNRKLARWDGRELNVYGIEEYPVPSSYPYLIRIAEDRLVLGGAKLTPQLLNLSSERWATYAGLNFQCEGPRQERWFLAEDRRVVRNDGATWEEFDTGDGVIDRPNRIIATADGAIWASGSHRGQAAVSLYWNGSWMLHSFPDVGGTFSHLAAIETRDGEVIFGSGTPEFLLGEAKGGAVVFRKTGQEYAGRHFPFPAFAKRTANIVEREGDGLLFSTATVYKTSKEHGIVDTTKDIFTLQWIDHMIVDEKNDLWVACLGTGLYHHDGTGWRLHGRKDGLDTKNIVYLAEDRRQGGILALTDKGFYRYDGVGWSPWGFSTNFAFARENHTVFHTSDGAVWLNYSNRSWLLELSDSGSYPHSFQTIRFMPDGGAPQTWASLPQSRIPEGGQIQVGFQGADLWEETPRRDLAYSWSLDGETWSAYAAEASATFSQLEDGAYRLLVRARDLSGNVDPTPAVVAFSVVPPIWQQAWFVLLMLGAAVAIGFLAYSLYRTRLKAALALDEFKLDFFTNISHELRNPLAVIISPVEMLLDAELDESVRRKLQFVLRNARRMQGMIDQLLEFRKIDLGRWTLNHEGGDIVGFIRDAVKNHEPVWQARNQTMNLQSSVEAYLCSYDFSCVQKIVDNLVSNAIKYSGDQTALRVSVKIEHIDGHDHCVLEVEDDGAGIPLHEQKNILQPFYRVRRDLKQEGSGLGLSLVSQLVRLCGGSLDLKSPVRDDGRGTRFTVVLPVEPYQQHKETEDAVAPAARGSEGRPVLMFVEDNEDLRHVLVDAFSDEYQVIEAGDGESGFQLAESLNPDLVVSDVMMPGISGNELCEKLKTTAETSHIPVILLTARSSAEHRIEGLRAGADAYIPKPLDLKHLRARIENLLSSRRELKKKFARQLVVEATEITVTPTDERIITKAIKVVEDSMMDEDFNVDRFAQLMGMSRSTLKRKLSSIIGLSPQPFIQQLRLKRAAQLLTTGGLSVSEVARMVGFYDLSYFGSVFKKEFGCAPSHYAQTARNKEKVAPS
jgi:signal transduction histidine kinase/DNA-binding response OmpR family regulator